MTDQSETKKHRYILTPDQSDAGSAGIFHAAKRRAPRSVRRRPQSPYRAVSPLKNSILPPFFRVYRRLLAFIGVFIGAPRGRLRVVRRLHLAPDLPLERPGLLVQVTVSGVVARGQIPQLERAPACESPTARCALIPLSFYRRKIPPYSRMPRGKRWRGEQSVTLLTRRFN